MRESYYRPSGKLKASYFLWLILFWLISIPILSVAYIYAVHYLPYIWLAIFLAFGCGALLGLVINWAAKLGKVRNPAVVMVSAIVGSLLMKYVQWCVYVPLIKNVVYEWFLYEYGYTLTFLEQLLEGVINLFYPLYVLDWALIINEYGVWAFTRNNEAVGDSVTGVILLLIWIGELIILGGTAILVSGVRPKTPFSEESGAWYVICKEAIETDYPVDFEQFKHKLENGNFEELLTMAAAGKSNEELFMRLVFHTAPAPSYAEKDYLSISQVSMDKKKRVKQKEVLKYLAIDQQTVVELIHNSQFIMKSKSKNKEQKQK